MFTLDKALGSYVLTQDSMRVSGETREFAANMSNMRHWPRPFAATSTNVWRAKAASAAKTSTCAGSPAWWQMCTARYRHHQRSTGSAICRVRCEHAQQNHSLNVAKSAHVVVKGRSDLYEAITYSVWCQIRGHVNPLRASGYHVTIERQTAPSGMDSTHNRDNSTVREPLGKRVAHARHLGRS